MKSSKRPQSTVREPKCASCKVHGVVSYLKGHKRFCEWKDCECGNCRNLLKRQRAMSVKVHLSTSTNETFLYFGYGSNLLAKRIHIQNPTAVRKGIGQLRDYRLDFIGFSQRWGGAPATIVPTVGDHVWGAIWEIDLKNMGNLDNQEGVAENIYFAKDVNVILSDGHALSCRVYQRTVDPPPGHDTLNPVDKPSYLYLQTIIQGAVESKIPADYVEKLQSIPHNDYRGMGEIGTMLE